ncbi:glutamate receptor 2.8-like [Dioscorea cayenensis subsp. rotundata]|uniref:Glutamate receptor n=1 Tax=Dioscorea cayennensis subsp. rotundata TaxID=55577 RepID=A0AB40AXF6_DIOCR|nr:glutamate receptor 2.8-like [Dioscorea cayenensis subsp. rotundata]
MPNYHFFLVFFCSSFSFICCSFNKHGGGVLLPALGMAQNTTIVHVDLVLDLESLAGKRSHASISMALDDFYACHPSYKTRLLIHSRDSKQNIIHAASAALDLLKNFQAQVILGPLTSPQAVFITDLGNETQVPIVSFSVTSPSISPENTPYFVRTTVNDSSQVGAISSLVKSFGWREVVLVYENTEYGSGVIPYLVDAFQEIDARVPHQSVISPSVNDDQLNEELYKLMTMQTRVFVVHMRSSLTSRLFLKAKEIGMMEEGYVWIMTDGIGNMIDSLDPRSIDAMQGAVAVRSYVPRSQTIANFTTRWKTRFRLENPSSEPADPSVFELWAYDTVWALAMATEKAGVSNSSFRRLPGGDNSTDLGDLGISQNGPELLETLLSTRFRGLSGEFCLVNGQQQSSVFEIVNVIGKGARNIAFWTPEFKISKQFNSASPANLKTIIWPGDTITVSKGWEIPTNGKRLKIGVPVKIGFNEFVNVVHDNTTNRTTVTGYCIDVFEAVMQSLPYAVQYDYIPFEKPGQSYTNYTDLVYQVFLQVRRDKYDAVVGDVTIIANRSNNVDFTLPYTESGVSMIALVKENKRRNMWIFLKPLTTNLWLGTLSFFFFTGCVVWLIEHRINPEFRGPPSQQLGIIFYFAFSTLVYAHRERLKSNLSRVVVVIWVFVVLILTSSYTASLTSMLTVQQLQPTVTNLTEILKNGEHIGYQDGSFVVDMLRGIGFKDRQMKNYSTREEYNEALIKGTTNGGVAAIFDEIPYLKLFLSKYYADFTMVGKTYKTDGFGFVFPFGSPLSRDVSRAILNVTESDTMKAIERKWFGDLKSCPSDSSKLGSSRLNFRSFGGLFLITGVVSVLALILFFTIYIYQNWNELRTVATKSSVWTRIGAWIKHFRDLNSHTFRREGQMTMSNRKSKQEPLHTASVPATPAFDSCQSPMSIQLSDMNSGTPEGLFSAELRIQYVETQTEDAPVRTAKLASVE